MGFLRRGVFFLFSTVLFISLLGIAFGISSNLTLAKPAKVESLLAESKFYDHFADNVVDQAQASTNNSIGVGKIAFTNPLVRQAAHDALSQQFLQPQGNSLIENNYAWLEGKKTKPDFRIDLTPARHDFAKRVGQAATIRLAALPACSAQQQAQVTATPNTDLLSLICRPATVDPKTEGDRLASELKDNSAFLSNPIITPTSINPTDSTQTEPYYQKLSALPKIYQINLKAPYILGGLALLCLIFMYFLAAPKRKFTRRLAAVLLVAGIILVLNKLIADVAFNRLQTKTFSAGKVGPLEQSILDFFHRIEAQLVQVDLYFGIAFLALALMLFVSLWLHRPSSVAKQPKRAQPFTPPSPTTQQPEAPLKAGRFRAASPPQPTVVDVAPASRPSAPTLPKSTPGPSAQPRKRPPRLIQ